MMSIVPADLCFILQSCNLTETQKNGGDDKSKNVERNPSNILPGIKKTVCDYPADYF